MGKLNRFLDVLDNITERIGSFAWLLIPVLTLVVTYEVITRYVLRVSNTWAFDSDQFLLMTIIALGGGWAFLHRGHVNVDIIYSHFSQRGKAIADVLTYPVVFIVLFVLLREFGSNAFDSLKLRETTQSMWAPPVYPVKLLALLGIFLFLLQSFVKFTRDLVAAITGKHVKKKYVGMFEKEE